MATTPTAAARRPGRARLMRAVHAVCRKLGLDDDARHDIQVRLTGRTSMRDMGVRELDRLLRHLNGHTGAGPGAGGADGGRRHATAPRADLRLVHALWGELGRRGALTHPGRGGLNAFIRARFGPHWAFVPMDVDALTDTACITDVIRALRAMLARAETGDSPDDGGSVT